MSWKYFTALNDDDIAGAYLDFVMKYVLFDDVIDLERDVKDNAKKRSENHKRQRRLK